MMKQLSVVIAGIIFSFFTGGSVYLVRATDLPTLTVTNSLNVLRIHEPATFGVPFAESLALDAKSQLAVVDVSGVRTPVQLTPLAAWSSGAVKWALLDFLSDVPPKGKVSYQLVKETTTNTSPVSRLSVTDHKTHLEIDTGPITVWISRERFSGLERVLRDMDGDGQKEIVVLATQEAGLRYVEDGETFFTTQSPPEVVKVEYAGPLHALITVRGWFTTKGKADYLFYVARYHFFAGQDSIRMALTVTDRHDRPLTEGVWDKYWNTQRVHDLTFVTMVKPDALGGAPQLWSGAGNALDGNTLSVAYPYSHVRMVFHDDRSVGGRIEIVGISGSPNEWIPSNDAAFLEGWKGSYYLTHSVQGARQNHVSWIPSITVPGPYEVFVSYAAFKPSAEYLQAKGVTYEVTHAGGETQVKVDQTPIRGDGWRSLGTYKFAAGESARVKLFDTGTGKLTADGVRLVYRGGKVQVPDIILLVGKDPLAEASDRRTVPCEVGMVGTRGAVAVGLGQCWQNHPSALKVSRAGSVHVDLLPGGPHTVMGGMGKTWDLVWVLGSRMGTGGLAEMVERGLAPLHALASSVHYAKSGVFGRTAYAPMAEPGKNPDSDAYEKLVTMAVKGILDERISTDAFGWRDYGDYLIKPSYGSGVQDWANNQHFQAYGAMVQYLRTGDVRWWRLGESATRHMLDVDFVKFHPFREKYNGTVHRKGDCVVPHTHVCQEPLIEMGFAPEPAFLLYHLTGDLWWKEVGMMGVQAQRNFLYGEFSGQVFENQRLDFVSSGERPTGWILRGLLAGYAETYQQEYLELATRVVNRLIEKQDLVTGTIANASVYSPASALSVQPQWLGWAMDGLIQYYDLTKDKRVREVLVRLAKFIKDYTLREQDIADDDHWRGHEAARYVLYEWTYERTPSVRDGKALPVIGTVAEVSSEGVLLEPGRASGWDRTENYRGKRLLVMSGTAKDKGYIISSSGEDGQGRPWLKSECVRGIPVECSDAAKNQDFASIGLRPGDTIRVLQYYEYSSASVWTTLNGLAFATKETGDPAFMQTALLNFRDSAHAFLSRLRFGGTAVAGDYLAFPFYFLNYLLDRKESEVR